MVQECENPAQSTNEYRTWAGDYLWVGTSKNKNIGVFAKNGNQIRALNWNIAELKLFLPFSINDKYNVLGVWTKRNDSGSRSYLDQFWKLLQTQDNDISKKNTLLLDDLNSNAIWDKKYSSCSHTDIINELKNRSVESLYHHQFNEIQGEETTPTFFMQCKEIDPIISIMRL